MALSGLFGCSDTADGLGVGSLLWQADPQAALQSSRGREPLNSLQGKVLLVNFGYLHCPDVCPASMAVTGQVLGRLTPQERARMRAVFITVDPERDGPDQLRDYLAFFHPEMVGLRTSPEALKKIALNLRVAYIKQAEQPGGAYAVDHSAQTLLFNVQAKKVRELRYGASADEVLAAVRSVL